MKIKHLLIAIVSLFTVHAFAMSAKDNKLIISVEALEDPNNPLHVLNTTYTDDNAPTRSGMYAVDVFGSSLDIHVKPFNQEYELTFVVDGVKYGVLFMRLQGQTKQMSLSSVMRELGAHRITGFEAGRKYWEAQDRDYKNKGILVLDNLGTVAPPSAP